MSPSPCCQPKSADARFGMALSCVWACAAAPTAREATSTALHRKAVLDIASSSITKFKSTVWQMPICLAFLCLRSSAFVPPSLSRLDTHSLDADAVSRAIAQETAFEYAG